MARSSPRIAITGDTGGQSRPAAPKRRAASAPWSAQRFAAWSRVWARSWGCVRANQSSAPVSESIEPALAPVAITSTAARPNAANAPNTRWPPRCRSRASTASAATLELAGGQGDEHGELVEEGDPDRALLIAQVGPDVLDRRQVLVDVLPGRDGDAARRTGHGSAPPRP